MSLSSDSASSDEDGQTLVTEASDPETKEEATDLLLPRDSEIKPTLTVVMPTLNEEHGVAESIERAKTAICELGVTAEIIVSDSSDDRTPDIARELGAIVVEPTNDGYGAAYRYAFEHARGEYIAMGDADCTYDFEELPKLYRKVVNGEADIAMGTRLEGEIKPGAMPLLHRYVGNPLLTKFLNVFYDADVSDAHSGMRVFSRAALDEMNLTSNGMEFASEMVMEASVRDLTIVEEPITYYERRGEETLDSLRDGWRHVKFMLLNAPGYLFTVPGLLMSAIGVVVMTLAFFEVTFGGVRIGEHSMIAGSLLTIVGHQVAAFGALATVAGDPIRQPNDRVTRLVTRNIAMEQGVKLGLVLVAIGAGYVALGIYRWIQSGYTQLPGLLGDVVAFTVIVLGIQVIFESFLLSALARDLDGHPEPVSAESK